MADGGVRGYAGPRVRPATLQRHHKFRRRRRCARRLVHLGQHRGDLADPQLDTAAQPAHLLNVHRLEQRSRRQPVSLDQPVDLHHLAAQPRQQHPAHIGIARIAPQRALQHLEARAITAHRAAGAMHKRHNPVDIGIIRQLVRREMRRDLARGGGRAVHRRQHRDIVARANAATGAVIALKRVLRGRRGHGAQVGAKFIFGIDRAKLQVVRVHMRPLGNVFGGIADQVGVFAHRFTLGNRLRRHLVAARDQHGRPLVAHLQRLGGGDDIVVGRQSNSLHGLTPNPRQSG